MDSLLATYASSDEEEEQQQQHREENHQQNQNLGRPSKFSQPSSSIPSSSIFSSLPQPKSSSLFSSLPPPNIQTPSLSSTHKADDDDDDDSISTSVYIGVSSAKFSGTAKISPLFSSLPEPKSHLSNPPTSTNPSSSIPKPKRVVQFKPPINPISVKSHDDIDDDEDDEENERKRRKELDSFIQTPSVKSFLSSIPAPKNSGAATLGALPSSGSGRRSIIEADIPASTVGHEVGIDSNVTNYDSNWIEGSSSASSLGAVDGQSGSIISGGDPSNWVEGSENYGNYGSYVDYGSYGHNYESNWVDRSTTSTMPEMPVGMSESMLRVAGKRGRNEVPMEIVEVKQDELIKNRPREDQVKLTGIAFGPSYQPVSAKGKPTKLHKRKHQISSLYYDMKQKEMELSERRAKGFLTKAETQAKYGW